MDPEQTAPTDVDLDASKHNSRRHKQMSFRCELRVTHRGVQTICINEQLLMGFISSIFMYFRLLV